MAEALELYASLVKRTRPFGATNEKRNLPVLLFLTTNLPDAPPLRT